MGRGIIFGLIFLFAVTISLNSVAGEGHKICSYDENQNPIYCSCPPGEYWDEGQCVDIPSNVKCSIYEKWNGEKCVNPCLPDEYFNGKQCIPDTVICTSENYWDGEICITEYCPSEFWINGKCVEDCNIGYLWDIDLGECVFNECPSGKIWNGVECIDDPKCPPGYSLNFWKECILDKPIKIPPPEQRGPPPGTITIIMDTVPNDAQDFAFTDNIAAPNAFSLDDDADGTLDNTKTFPSNSPGVYTVIQIVDPNYTTTVHCVDPDNDSTLAAVTNGATIVLDEGESITCTFTSRDLTYEADQEIELEEGLFMVVEDEHQKKTKVEPECESDQKLVDGNCVGGWTQDYWWILVVVAIVGAAGAIGYQQYSKGKEPDVHPQGPDSHPQGPDGHPNVVTIELEAKIE